MKKYIALLVFIGFLFAAYQVFFIEKKQNPKPAPVPMQEMKDREIVAANLEIPWELVFLPDAEMLVTERPGRLLKIGKDKKVIQINGVRHVGEGGLLGLALDPKFQDNNFIYLYLTSEENGRLINRVERYVFRNDSMSERKVIVGGIKGSTFHDGGRLAFGPDGYLYVTTGDAETTNLAQDKNSLNGKILRVSPDGSIPKDNPYGNAVYSWGHRNVQGIAWDESGNLWATEHGRSFPLSGYDELNFIEKGNNYGWPVIQGNGQKSGMVVPIINSGTNETWAPSGAAYYKGSIFFAGLKGQTLYEAKIKGRLVTQLKKHLQKQYGRLRTIKVGPDGYFYLLTNNRDGRGHPLSDDDKIIRINPKTLL